MFIMRTMEALDMPTRHLLLLTMLVEATKECAVLRPTLISTPVTASAADIIVLCRELEAGGNVSSASTIQTGTHLVMG